MPFLPNLPFGKRSGDQSELAGDNPASVPVMEHWMGVDTKRREKCRRTR